MDEKLNKIIEGVKSLNEKHADLESRSATDTAEAKEALEKIKTDITNATQEMQEMKQKAAAQEESFNLMQKEVLARNGNDNNGIKELFKEYDNHLAKYLRKGVPVPDEDVEKICNDIAKKTLFGVNEDQISREQKDLVAGSNTDGGFFLTTDRSNTMSVRMFETSALRPIANVQTTTSDVWEIILDDDEPDSGWVGEVTSRPDTDTAQIGLVKIPIHELYAQPRATQKMIDDAGFDIVSWHQNKVTSKFSRDENLAFTTGDGASKPKGFLSYAAWAVAGTYERNAVEQLTSATATTIEADDLIALMGALLEDYQGNAQWAMSRETFFNYILTLKDSYGQYLINPRLIAEGGQMVILGRPVNLFGDMPNVANNALSVAIADWREFYTIIDRMGIRVLRDPYTSKPYVRFYTTKRVGGAVTNFEAGKILKIKSS